MNYLAEHPVCRFGLSVWAGCTVCWRYVRLVNGHDCPNCGAEVVKRVLAA